MEAEAETLDDMVLSSTRIEHLQSSELLGRISAAGKKAAALLQGKNNWGSKFEFDIVGQSRN